MSTIGTRYKTGQVSPCKAEYDFDGYTDGTSTPSPTTEEKKITLTKDETFPPIRSTSKACYWVLSYKY